jgi:hypothetical protein
MARELSLVEGPTERNFGQRLLAAHLGDRGIAYHPRVIGKPGHKGGVGEWDRAKRELLGLIRQEPNSLVTTMFDLYALPRSWPGRQEALDLGLSGLAAVQRIEHRIADAVRDEVGGSGAKLRFIPYISQHEYEALLFSNPVVLADVTQGRDDAARFQAILDECGGCEDIDDSPLTAPSKRILRIAPNYEKTVDGIAAAERMGLVAIRAKCPHFDAWLAQLESEGHGD